MVKLYLSIVAIFIVLVNEEAYYHHWILILVNGTTPETRGGTADASKHGSPQLHETRDTISLVAGDRIHNVVSSINKNGQWLISRLEVRRGELEQLTIFPCRSIRKTRGVVVSTTSSPNPPTANWPSPIKKSGNQVGILNILLPFSIFLQTFVTLSYM